ncbi:MAG: hypothetical protein M3Y81_20710 [Chloroflexota bacterium]|nr:hypothetical protein [Chloroflexota bacterium]
MNQQQRDSQRRGMEFIIFLGASVIGIYGLGRGLTGMFEPGQGISLPWLAVTGVAFIVLFAQMGRVHDTWPRKPEKQSQSHTNEQMVQQPSMKAEER